MRTYNYLSNELPRELIEVYNDLQVEVMRIITRRLKQRTNPDIVMQEIRMVIDGYNPKIEKIVAIIFADDKKRIVNDGKKEIEKDKEPLTNNEANSIVAPKLIKAMAVLSAISGKILTTAINEYRRNYMFLIAPATRLLSAEQKFNQAVKNLAINGFQIYEMSGNRVKNYSLENIIKRDFMYQVNQTNNEIAMSNFQRSGAKFIEVSSHPTARTWNKYMKHDYEDHSSWQGKVYYSGERVDGYEEFESTCGYGEMLGIGGINCYHQFTMNYDGKSTETQFKKREVEKNYALSQQQRKYERDIRKLKQAQAIYEEAGNNVMANRLNGKIIDRTNELKNFCDRNNLKYYNWRTEI